MTFQRGIVHIPLYIYIDMQAGRNLLPKYLSLYYREEEETSVIA